MTDPRWESLVADVIAEFAHDEPTAEDLLRRLKNHGDWEVALAQFRSGATDRNVRWILQRPLIMWCGKNGSR